MQQEEHYPTRTRSDFFIEVARIMRTWDRPGAMTDQAWYIGRHLRTCACSTEEAREFVSELALGAKP